jgi:hypothetical protein
MTTDSLSRNRFHRNGSIRFFRSRGKVALSFVSVCSLIVFVAPVPASAGITDNPGFSAGNYSVCNYPNAGDSVTSYGPDRNASGITLTSSNWRCTGGGIGANGEPVVAIGQPILLEKLDLQTPRFGGGGYTKDLVSISWDYENDGVIDITDSGPWNSWYLDRGHPYVRGTYFSSTHTYDVAGTYAVAVTATYDDATTEQATGTIKVVSDTVTAVINRIDVPTGIPNDGAPVLTGTAQQLSAFRSTSLSGVLSRYEWDLDGDGAYETDGGTTSTYTTSFASTGLKTVGVRVTSRGGSTSAASMSIEVRQSPPSGEPGVSVKDGASFTNSKTVQLNLVWPDYATEARLSNDGGFAASKTRTVALANSVEWELDDSVKGIYTKVVYVRFNGSGIDITKTYSDDIILDTNAPTVDSSSIATASGNMELSLKATDDVTGVDKVEIRNGGNKVEKSFAAKVRVPLSDLGLKPSTSSVQKLVATTISFRVSDVAGNWTAWQDMALGGATPAIAASFLSKSKTLKVMSIATFAKLSVPSTSKVSLKVASSSVKNCKVVGALLKGLKIGLCKVTVTVMTKKGRAVSRAVTLKVTK